MNRAGEDGEACSFSSSAMLCRTSWALRGKHSGTTMEAEALRGKYAGSLRDLSPLKLPISLNHSTNSIWNLRNIKHKHIGLNPGAQFLPPGYVVRREGTVSRVCLCPHEWGGFTPSPSHNTSTCPMSFQGVPQCLVPGPFPGGTPVPCGVPPSQVRMWYQSPRWGNSR